LTYALRAAVACATFLEPRILASKRQSRATRIKRIYALRAAVASQLFRNREFNELNEFMHCVRLLLRNYGLSADGKDEHRLLVIDH
jgi:hypothetical protein